MATNTQTSIMASFPISAKDFNSPTAKGINQLVDYYEGRQLQHVTAMLDGKHKGGYGKRGQWKERGMVPRARNVTKSIVDKSGMLFFPGPKLSIDVPGQVTSITDPVFNAIMETADWLEIFQNVDVYTRLTKSCVLLCQKYIPEDTVTINGQYKFDQTNGDALLLSVHHQGDSVVKMNPQRTKITAFAFLTDTNGDGCEQGAADKDTGVQGAATWSYRLITESEIIDVLVKEESSFAYKNATQQSETIVGRQPNPDGIVPACFFYDINKPRLGYWNAASQDLMSLQEIVNLHLTEMEFAISWQKQKTAVVTGKIINSDDNLGSQMVPAAPAGFTPGGAVYNDIPFYQQKSVSSVGGLGSIIQLGLDDSGNPAKLTFEGPNSDLKALQDVIESLIEGIANDWDVNLRVGGGGSATSGFQLVVEEVNNLNLRQKRSQSMVAGMRRFYEIMLALYPGQLTEGQLQVEFAPPNLPVNVAEQERLWDDKISNNRATIVDYLMEVKGMTEEQATARLHKNIAINNMVNKEVVPAAPPAPTDGTIADAALKPQKVDMNNG